MQDIKYLKISYLCVVVVVTVLSLVGLVQCARPVLYNLPATVYIGDEETTERLVDFLNVTELNNNGYTCTVSSITGTLAGSNKATNGNEFQIKYDTTYKRYELWTTTAGAGVFEDTTIDKYRVSITCTNSLGEVSSGNNYFDVNVINNDRLIFQTLPTTTTKSAAAIKTSTTIHTETVRDHSGSSDGIVCSLKHASLTGYFDVNPATCAVYATADLIGIDASIPSVTLMIGATDPTTKITTYSTLTVSLTNQNTKPTTNTNGAAVAQTWPESTASGTLLHAVTVSDPDSGQTHTYSMNCTPTSGDSFVDIDSNGQIKVISALNYETANFFDCDYYISDGTHTGGPFDYNITITNVNDAPTFVDSTYYATFAEGAAGTLATSNPNISCTDQDTTNTKTYSFLSSTYSKYFSVDSSGKLSLAQAYDIDNSANPSSVVLTLLCTDGNTVDGTTKTGTATLSVTITDANDNAPTFSPTSYTIYVNQNTKAGATIGTYKPTDADSGVNGQYSCASTTSSSYGSVYSVLADCTIVLTTQTKPFGDGTAVQYTVTATDQGTPARTGTGYVNVIYQETTTTTVATTTTSGYNFFDHPENIAMFVLLLLAALALLALLAWCLSKMCCGANMGNMCGKRSKRPPKRRAITPESDRTPPRRRRNYSPEPQKVTVIRERPPMPTMYKPGPPPYYPPPRGFPGTFPGSPFVPLR